MRRSRGGVSAEYPEREACTDSGEERRSRKAARSTGHQRHRRLAAL